MTTVFIVLLQKMRDVFIIVSFFPEKRKRKYPKTVKTAARSCGFYRREERKHEKDN
jgi:hypothetical protein